MEQNKTETVSEPFREPFRGFPTYVSHPAVAKGIFTREDEDYWPRDEYYE